MWPLPLVSKPSKGSQAGPSPPEPPAVSTLSLAEGSKIASPASATSDVTPDELTTQTRSSNVRRAMTVALQACHAVEALTIILTTLCKNHFRVPYPVNSQQPLKSFL